MRASEDGEDGEEFLQQHYLQGLSTVEKQLHTAQSATTLASQLSRSTRILSDGRRPASVATCTQPRS